MAYIQSEIEEAIRVNGHHPMRAMFGNVRPIVCSFTETQIYNHGSRPNGSGLALSEVPRDGGTQRTPANVRDHYDAHHSKIRPMTLSRVVTAVFFNYLKAKEEADRLWSDFELLSDYEKAVKQNAEPKLLGK